MPVHLYQVGTVVYLQPSEVNMLKASRSYLVEAQMPPVGTSFQYRIKSEAEDFRRVVTEYQVSPVVNTATVPPAAPPHSGEED